MFESVSHFHRRYRLDSVNFDYNNSGSVGIGFIDTNGEIKGIFFNGSSTNPKLSLVIGSTIVREI